MKRKLKWLYLIGVILLMGLIEKNMTYWPKSVFKIILFLLLPSLLFKLKYTYTEININKKARYLSLAVVLAIISGYFILGNFMDFDLIRIQLDEMMGVNRNNFFWITLYISFVNAGIEEFFFRGVYYLEEGNTRNTLISASAFALYHLAIMDTWVSLPLLLLGSLGLVLVGLVLNYLTLKSNNIYNAYFVHLTANLTLNTIAFLFIL